MFKGVVSSANVTTVAAAGLGAVAAAMAQTSVPMTVGDNTRDLILTVAGAAGVAMGGQYLRPFAVGFAAVALGSIVRRNMIGLTI